MRAWSIPGTTQGGGAPPFPPLDDGVRVVVGSAAGPRQRLIQTTRGGCSCAHRGGQSTTAKGRPRGGEARGAIARISSGVCGTLCGRPTGGAVRGLVGGRGVWSANASPPLPSLPASLRKPIAKTTRIPGASCRVPMLSGPPRPLRRPPVARVALCGRPNGGRTGGPGWVGRARGLSAASTGPCSGSVTVWPSVVGGGVRGGWGGSGAKRREAARPPLPSAGPVPIRPAVPCGVTGILWRIPWRAWPLVDPRPLSLTDGCVSHAPPWCVPFNSWRACTCFDRRAKAQHVPAAHCGGSPHPRTGAGRGGAPPPSTVPGVSATARAPVPDQRNPAAQHPGTHHRGKALDVGREAVTFL